MDNFINSQIANDSFFFDIDSDGHWYVIPSHMRMKWEELIIYYPQTVEEFQEFENIFGVFRIGTHPSSFDIKIIDSHL